MVSIVAAVGLLIIVGVHTAVAAVMTRFFRLRLETAWGAAIYSLFLIPILLTLSMFILSGPLGLGADLGSPQMVFVVAIAIPLVLGYTIDVFWMPHPDDVELPETME